MYQLYIANKNYSSWSLRPWVLMKECGVPFEEILVPFQSDNHQQFRRFSPSGKVPCLVDDGQVVWDSMAITEYLAERYAGVWPSPSPARVWARCVAAEIHSGFATLRQRCSMNCGVRIRPHGISLALQRDLDRIDDICNEGLNQFGGPFLAGPHFGAVDAFFAPISFRIQTYQLDLSLPTLGYAERLRALPSMMLWYNDALAETWRDREHEAEIEEYGGLVADLRRPPNPMGGGK